MAMSIPKRLTKEIENVKKKDVEQQGIFYTYDDSNLMHGKAMIVGPEGTPYEGCLLCFQIKYPHDYPLSSPAVKIITTDGHTRFHPNLYIDGKVCLSILGTWRGPKWAPGMNISGVLTSIQSLLEENPIVNEPGYESLRLSDGDSRAYDYAELVQFRLVLNTFHSLLNWKNGCPPSIWGGFEDILTEYGDQFLTNIIRVIEKKALQGDKLYEKVLYNMSGMTEWNNLLQISKKWREGKIASVTP